MVMIKTLQGAPTFPSQNWVIYLTILALSLGSTGCHLQTSVTPKVLHIFEILNVPVFLYYFVKRSNPLFRNALF